METTTNDFWQLFSLAVRSGQLDDRFGDIRSLMQLEWTLLVGDERYL